jgi:hypothetical protein
MRYLVFISILLIKSVSLFGQDTVIVYNNYKYKIGVEFISDKSADFSLNNDLTRVYGGGIQIVKKIKDGHYSLLSGLYYQNRALLYGYLYHTITYPLGMRYENKIFYFSAEGYINYILKQEIFIPISGDDRYRKFNTGIILSIGIEKQICKRLDFFMVAHFMNSVTKTLKEERNAYSYIENRGISLGLNYKIF